MERSHARPLAVVTGASSYRHVESSDGPVAASRALRDSVKAERHREMAEPGSTEGDRR